MDKTSWTYSRSNLSRGPDPSIFGRLQVGSESFLIRGSATKSTEQLCTKKIEASFFFRDPVDILERRVQVGRKSSQDHMEQVYTCEP